MISNQVFFYSNRMGRVILRSMEEILGRNEGNTISDVACQSENIDKYDCKDPDKEFPFEHISHLQAALESVYGIQAGRGLALRIGRVCVKYILREFGSDLGLFDPAFHLLPLPSRLKAGTEALAGLFNRFTDQVILLQVDKKQISWHIERCPLCWKRQSDHPCCSLAVGILQETLYWVSGGKYYMVEEKKCVACGDSECLILIDRNPVS